MQHKNIHLQEDRERLKRFRPIDDTFLRVMLKNNTELAELILRIVLDDQTIQIKSGETQVDMKRLVGTRSEEFDYLANGNKVYYNIEAQRDNKKKDHGWEPERLFMYLAAMANENLKPGAAFTDLPDAYCIFITEKDPIGDGKAVHKFCFYDAENQTSLGLKQFMVYANGAYEGDDEIGKLMHDFRCNDPKEMYYDEMRTAAEFYKSSPEGVEEMCQIMEDLRKETMLQTRQEDRRQTATAMLEDQKPLAEIMKYSFLPEKEIRELADALKVAVVL